MSVVRYGPWLPTRELAKAVGAKHYFTGLPCVHGHLAPRKSGNRICVDCISVAPANKRAIEKYLASEKGKQKNRKQQSLLRERPEHRAKEKNRLDLWRSTDEGRERVRVIKRRYVEKKRLEREFDRFMERLQAGEDVYGIQT